MDETFWIYAERDQYRCRTSNAFFDVLVALLTGEGRRQ